MRHYLFGINSSAACRRKLCRAGAGKPCLRRVIILEILPHWYLPFERRARHFIAQRIPAVRAERDERGQMQARAVTARGAKATTLSRGFPLGNGRSMRYYTARMARRWRIRAPRVCDGGVPQAAQAALSSPLQGRCHSCSATVTKGLNKWR